MEHQFGDTVIKVEEDGLVESGIPSEGEYESEEVEWGTDVLYPPP